MYHQGTRGWLEEMASRFENVLPGVTKIVVSETQGTVHLAVTFAWWSWLTLGVLHVMTRQALRQAIAPWLAAGVRLKVK